MEEQGFLFTKEMLKQTKMDYILENVSAKINVSIRKTELLLLDYDLKCTRSVIPDCWKCIESFSGFFLWLRELNVAGGVD